MSAPEASTVLVLGGSGDIGRAVAVRLAELGYRVALAGRSAERLEESAAAVTAAGGAAATYPIDLRDRDAVQDLIGTVAADLGRLDVLVNAVGVVRLEFVMRATPETWEEALETNLLGAVHASRAVLPIMRRQRSGHILHIGSVLGSTGGRAMAAYSASKAGLAAFTESLRLEVAKRGIKVTLIEPAAVDTRMHGDENPSADTMLRPSDVAEAVAFVLSLSPTAVVRRLTLEDSSG